MMSDIASQTFVFQCDDIVGWYDQVSQSTEHAVKLLGLNEHLFDTAYLDGIKVTEDGCKVNTSRSPYDSLDLKSILTCFGTVLC